LNGPQQGWKRPPQKAHLPLEPHTVPLLHELPLQQSSPFLPQCWQVLPPNVPGAQTFENVQAEPPDTQQGEPVLPHGSQRLVDALHAYCDPASWHRCQSRPGQQVPNAVPQGTGLQTLPVAQ